MKRASRHLDPDEDITLTVFARSGFEKSPADGRMLGAAELPQSFADVAYFHLRPV